MAIDPGTLSMLMSLGAPVQAPVGGMQLAAADPRIITGPPQVPKGSTLPTPPPVPPPQITIPTPSFGGGGGQDVTAAPGDERFQNPNPTAVQPLPGGANRMTTGSFSKGAVGDIIGAGTAGAMYAGGTPWDLAGSVGGTIGNVAGMVRPQDTAARIPGSSPGASPTAFPPPPSTGDGQSTGTPTSGKSNTEKLADALRGVKAPEAPTAQTVRTPQPPQVVPIRGGEFIAMLSSLGITPQEFVRMRGGR